MARVGSAVIALCMSVSLLVGVPTAFAGQKVPVAPTATPPLHLSGVIIDFSPVSLTIQSDTNVQAVRLTTSTTYMLNNHTLAAKPAFQYGEHARILALPNADGSLTAQTVILGMLATNGHGRIRGTVLDVTATLLTIKTANHDVFAVALTGKTHYYVATQRVSTRPAIQKGDGVGVSARQLKDGTLAALSVNLYGHASGTTKVTGRIIDFSATSLTIRSSTGDVFAVGLTTTTKYYLNGVLATTKPTIHYLEQVVVSARLNSNKSMTALTVRLTMP